MSRIARLVWPCGYPWGSISAQHMHGTTNTLRGAKMGLVRASTDPPPTEDMARARLTGLRGAVVPNLCYHWRAGSEPENMVCAGRRDGPSTTLCVSDHAPVIRRWRKCIDRGTSIIHADTGRYRHSGIKRSAPAARAAQRVVGSARPNDSWRYDSDSPTAIRKLLDRNQEDEPMRKLVLAIAAAALVSAMSLSSHQAEATVPAAPTVTQAAVKAANSTVTIGCVSRRVCSRGVCAMRRVCT